MKQSQLEYRTITDEQEPLSASQQHDINSCDAARVMLEAIKAYRQKRDGKGELHTHTDESNNRTHHQL